MAFVTANDQYWTEEKIQCKTEVNIHGMALKRSVFKRYGQWQLLTSAMSNADKRSPAKAITTIKNTKYVN